MRHQHVNVDYWSMFQTMFTYGVLTILCWVMIRLFHAVFTLPRRLQAQQENIQNTLKELQKRFPDLNITAEDLAKVGSEMDELYERDPGNENDEPNEEEEKENEKPEENKKDD
ncbi:RING finger protein PFF0165c [Vanessa cardui]|uniref:RING finger protein PFF0165c n=1 Tax=Vanessa cardui TaxID=171605 RepID=UPI001F133C34|nr:RING finger protein PFF0165c [Vanessa cardui]